LYTDQLQHIDKLRDKDELEKSVRQCKNNSYIGHVFMNIFVIYLYFHVYIRVQPRFVVGSALFIFLALFAMFLFCMSSICFLLDFVYIWIPRTELKFPQKRKIPNYKEVLQRPSYRYICTECVFVDPYTLHVTRSTYIIVLWKIYI